MRGRVALAAALVALVWLAAPYAATAEEEQPIKSMTIRTMIVTCKTDETIKFYEYVLGQKVAWDGFAPPSLVPVIWGGDPNLKIRFIQMEGNGEYPAGNILGTPVGFLGIDDPESPACKPVEGGKIEHGTVILPTRVQNIFEIEKRAKELGAEILYGPHPSPSRITYHMLLYDPNGIMLEVFDQPITLVPAEEGH